MNVLLWRKSRVRSVPCWPCLSIGSKLLKNLSGLKRAFPLQAQGFPSAPQWHVPASCTGRGHWACTCVVHETSRTLPARYCDHCFYFPLWKTLTFPSVIIRKSHNIQFHLQSFARPEKEGISSTRVAHQRRVASSLCRYHPAFQFPDSQ